MWLYQMRGSGRRKESRARPRSLPCNQQAAAALLSHLLLLPPCARTHPAKFKHAFKSAHHHALQVQLCCNAQCEGLAQCVVVGHKRPRVSTTSNSLQHRCLNLPVGLCVFLFLWGGGGGVQQCWMVGRWLRSADGMPFQQPRSKI